MMREPDQSTGNMRAIRLVSPRGLEGLLLEQVEVPRAGPDEAVVRVHAAAITRDELKWPLDRLPAIPSYELSGVIAALGPACPISRWATPSGRSPASTGTARRPSTPRSPHPCSPQSLAR